MSTSHKYPVRQFITLVEQLQHAWSETRDGLTFHEAGSFSDLPEEPVRFWAHLPSKRIFYFAVEVDEYPTEHIEFTHTQKAQELGLPPTKGAYDHLQDDNWVPGIIDGYGELSLGAKDQKVARAFLAWVLKQHPVKQLFMDIASKSIHLKGHEQVERFVRHGTVPSGGKVYEGAEPSQGLVEGPYIDGRVVPRLADGSPPTALYRIMSAKEFGAGMRAGTFVSHSKQVHADVVPHFAYAEPGDQNVLVAIQYDDADGWRAKWSSMGCIAATSDPIPASRVTEIARGDRHALEAVSLHPIKDGHIRIVVKERRNRRFAFTAWVGDVQVAAGEFQAELYGDKGSVEEIVVSSRFRRRGIAKAIYDHFEKMGFEVVPSDDLRPDGQAFWKARRDVKEHALRTTKVRDIDIEAAAKHLDMPMDLSPSQIRAALMQTKRELLALFKGQKQITVYRGLTVERGWTPRDGLGKSWSFTEHGALKGSGLSYWRPTHDDDLGVVIMGEVSMNDIDWPTTIAVNTMHPDEMEIVVEDGANVLVRKVAEGSRLGVDFRSPLMKPARIYRA